MLYKVNVEFAPQAEAKGRFLNSDTNMERKLGSAMDFFTPS